MPLLVKPTSGMNSQCYSNGMSKSILTIFPIGEPHSWKTEVDRLFPDCSSFVHKQVL